MSRIISRRNMLTTTAAAAGTVLLTGCDELGRSEGFRKVLHSAEKLTFRAQRLITDRNTLAREFPASDMSPIFRANGSTMPGAAPYQKHLAERFANWRLAIDGLVQTPRSWSLAELRAMPQRAQITRHDCVEGWSAIGEWTGPQLSAILDAAGVKEDAKFVVFRCADTYNGGRYYESVDMVDARHPQTIVAHSLNGEPLPEKNGAPLRMRIERQLGYKHAKYLTGIEVVDTLENIGECKGGYWEDRSGYQWYAGM